MVPLLIYKLYKLAGNAMTMFYCEPIEHSPAKFQSLVLLKMDFEYFHNINNFASMCACVPLFRRAPKSPSKRTRNVPGPFKMVLIFLFSSSHKSAKQNATFNSSV